MPGGKTHFQKDWLTRKDTLGHKISDWSQPKTENGKAFCFLCKKTGRYDNQGLLQLLQHAKTKSHQAVAHQILGGRQMVLTSNQLETPPDPEQKQATGTLTYMSHKDEATKAELTWTMKVVESHYSYSSCDNIRHLSCHVSW